MRLSAWGALVLVLASCGDDDGAARDAGPDPDAGPTGPVELVWSDTGGDFFDRPFPLESRRTADGAPDVAAYPNPRRIALVDTYVAAIHAQTDGFSPSGPIWFRFTGPLDVSALPADPAATRTAEAPIVLVNVDPESPDRGAITPVIVGYTEARDSFRPVDLLQIAPVPGFDLAEQTLYGVVVRTAIGSADPARPLQASAKIHDVIANEADFAPLRSWLEEQSIDPATVAAATVYRTGTVTARLFRAVEHVAALPAPVPTEPPAFLLEMPEYCAYAGAWEAPQFQDGMPPFADGGGTLQLDATGAPIEQRRERVPFVVAMPKGAMPAAGWPLLFYINGTGGLARQVIDRGVRATPDAEPTPGTGPAQVVARRGWGASGMAGIITEERVGAEVASGGYAVYDFTKPIAMRDNFAQSVLEHVLYKQLVLALRIDPTTCPGADASAAADGMLQYDPSTIVIMGQSLGSFLTGILSATDPDPGIRASILTGAGGSWLEFAFGVRSPPLQTAVEGLLGLPAGQRLDRFHPVIAAFDLAVGPADNLHYLDHLLRAPAPGRSARHVLIIEGDDDDNIGPGLQRALVAAIGADLVGEDVGAPQDRIEQAVTLAGRNVVAAPVSENVETPSGPRTAGVVRYLPDGDDQGHYVTFQLTEPKHQYGCFLETLLSGTPTIPPPAPEETPCP